VSKFGYFRRVPILIKATLFMKQLRISGVRGLLVLLCLVAATVSQAQTIYAPPVKKEAPLFKNLKVLSEESDGKGNIVRVIQYDQGVMRITETTIVPKVLPIGNASVKVDPRTMNKDSVRLVVDKARHCLMVYYQRRMVRAYKATFGPNPLQDKCMEGDRCTPEGEFKITHINERSKFNKFMQINYPNDSSLAKFNRLKRSGVLPSSARIGGDIGIHGIWPGGDNMIELGVGWTDGCVALTNKDIEELYSMVGVGTKVVIVKDKTKAVPAPQTVGRL
jgi:hypothetical protein